VSGPVRAVLVGYDLTGRPTIPLLSSRPDYVPSQAFGTSRQHLPSDREVPLMAIIMA
jgi:hypothetical protein